MSAGDSFGTQTIDLSTLVPRSVASLYSNLVTRPTGQALRMGIESQLLELGAVCVSILDFTQVVVLDYSCADEAIAKLIMRYQRDDRPANAFFIARGIAEQHLEPIESVLARHDLALVADLEGEGYTLLGAASDLEREAWVALQQLGAAPAELIAKKCQIQPEAATVALNNLAARRALLTRADGAYYSLSALIAA